MENLLLTVPDRHAKILEIIGAASGKSEFNNVDKDFVGELLEEMARYEKREVISQLKRLIGHVLKWLYQPEKRTNSWKVTIKNAQQELNDIFGDSRSLRNYSLEYFKLAYERGRDLAADETSLPLEAFPEAPETLDYYLNFVPEEN